MKLKKILAAIMSTTMIAAATANASAAKAAETSNIEAVLPELDFTQPSVDISTDVIKGYTSVIFIIPAEKMELFKKANSESDRSGLEMAVWFDDFSSERDEDVELPMAAYQIELNLTDPSGGKDHCFVETFVEDCGEDFLPIIEEINNDNGGYAAAVCFKNSESIAKAARNADELRIFYSIQSKGKYIDGSWKDYAVKMLKTDISKLKFGKISAKSYTGKALKPVVVVKDGNKKLVNGTDYVLSYKNIAPPMKPCQKTKP